VSSAALAHTPWRTLRWLSSSMREAIEQRVEPLRSGGHGSGGGLVRSRAADGAAGRRVRFLLTLAAAGAKGISAPLQYWEPFLLPHEQIAASPERTPQ